MSDSPREEEAAFRRLFDDADAKLTAAMKARKSAKTPNLTAYSYGGKTIAVTCIGCEEAIAKAEHARGELESLARNESDPMMKEGLSKLLALARRDEEQARERSLLHHHFPRALLEYDALIR